MRNFILFSFASLYVGLGIETFHNTLQGYMLMLTGFIIMLKIIFTLFKTKDSMNKMYYLQFWIALISLHNLTSYRELNFSLLTIGGIGGFYTIISLAILKEKEEKDGKINREEIS